MAELWYLEIDTETLEGREPRYVGDFTEAVMLFGLSPERWRCGYDEIPNIRTGNPVVDDSGYVAVLLRVTEEDIDSQQDKRWKPGWYLSPLTIVGAERALTKKR